MKKFFALILVAFFAVFMGCDENGLEVNNVVKVMDDVIDDNAPLEEPAPEITLIENTGFGKHSIAFWKEEELSKLPWVFEVHNIGIRYAYDPSSKATAGWDTGDKILIGRPSMISIPLWILDPERNCMLRSEWTEVEGFIEPRKAEIFNWDTGEPYRFHSPRWEGQPPEPIIKNFKNVHTNRDICPRKWFYRVTLPIYFKYLPNDDKTSREVGITTKEIGVSIEFENGEKLTWNLSEIYPELPPMPPFKFIDE